MNHTSRFIYWLIIICVTFVLFVNQEFMLVFGIIVAATLADLLFLSSRRN